MNELTNSEILRVIARFIKQNRLDCNITQADLSKHTGLHLNTLISCEKGGNISLKTFISILRSLNLLDLLSVFKYEETLSPLLLSELQKKDKKRKRASS